MIPLAARVKWARITTLTGYFALLALLLNWFTWIAPPVRLPRAFLLILLVVPLLLPLRGLLHGRRYTHQWTSFLALLYFAVGVDVWFNNPPGENLLGALTVLFSLTLFTGTVLTARWLGSPRVARRRKGRATP